jgi:hypothetical protein
VDLGGGYVKKKGAEHEDLTGNVAVRDLIEQEKQEELDKVIANAHDAHGEAPASLLPLSLLNRGRLTYA